jgi:putative transposase
VRLAYKCRAYPDPAQVTALNRTFGCVRLVWNKTLAARQAAWYERGESTFYRQTDAALTGWKKTEELAVDTDAPAPLSATGRQVGVDLGVKDFAVTSDGDRIANPLHLEKGARNLARYQRRMARCQRGSANRRKAKAKVARAHRKVRNARADFLHRVSTRLVSDHDVIVIEDLTVTNMVRNHRLAKCIFDCGWGEFRRQLEYKAERAGRRLVVIDRWYPSSKTCSACGQLLAGRSLSTRHWWCPACRARHDRDINAARNILAAGRAVARTTGDACGADVSHSGFPRVRSAVKQEPQPVTAGIPSFGVGSSQLGTPSS